MADERVQKVTVSHPSLGSLLGRRIRSSVLQFRSVPFATIPGRFRQSVLVKDLGDERDFTEYGFACPARHQDADWNGGPLPWETPRKYDEFKCLNLTISTPITSMIREDSRELSLRLPVLVYCHGGGFVEGAGNISDRQDTSNMVEISSNAGRPVVTVNIHYRLNYQGYLACKDLVEEAKSTGEPPSNFGLYDQRNAFLWVKEFIAGFGGDPENVTAFGESAGSGVICCQMSSTIPLFRRAILMAGAPAGLPPRTLERKEEEYLELLQHCGIDEKDPGRLEALRKAPVEKLVELATTKGMISHVVDFNFWPITPTGLNQGDLIRNCSWVEEVIIGDSFLEGSFYLAYLKDIVPKDYISVFEHNIGVETARRILDAYEIESSMDPNLFWQRSMMLSGDLLISEPMHAIANSLISNPLANKKVYRYTNTIRNPFPGSPMYQVCGHAVDLLYMFGNYLERFPTKRQRDISIEFVHRFTKFAHGLEPWEQYLPREQKIAVADGHVGWVTRTRAEDEEISKNDEIGERRYAQWDILGEVLRSLGERSDGVRENLMNLRKS